jgi:phage-related protein
MLPWAILTQLFSKIPRQAKATSFGKKASLTFVDFPNFSDGNGANPPEKYTPIWAVEVTADGLEIISNRVEILKNDPTSWEGILVEGPWMIYQYGYYYLFYSANGYASTLV